ncbi:DUF1189 family protein [Siminovitchia sp. FSL W7-1587]|uniref:DUF1189 family protein n=1 Tax=Siminovitchia sp. FSL W7-1587 TaxID=2954699 RepID=UPI0030D03F24
MRKISLLTIFYKSLYSPKEIAKYRFLPIGKAIQHVFIIALLFSLGSIIQNMTENGFLPGQAGEVMKDPGAKGIFAALYLLATFGINAALLFIAITLIAAVGEPAARFQERKLPYRQSWRVTAFSMTLPALLFGLLDVFHIQSPYFMLLAFAGTITMILLSIRSIPKPRKRT